MIILPIHVFIALTSVAVSTFAYFSPTKAKLYTTYGLVGLTLLSGTDLVIVSHSRILSACTSGLVYIGIMSVGIFATQRKLATQKSRQVIDE